MERASTDHLHRLIHAMTPAEKRYFKVKTTRTGTKEPNVQHLLFDAIAAMVAYDEQKLLRALRDPRMRKNFVMTKHRLHDALLRTLAAYHTESSVDARLARMLHQVEILYQKALYEDAERSLASARRLAQEQDKQLALLAVIRWEQRFLERNNYAMADAERLHRATHEADGAILEEQELNTLWDLKSKVFMDLYRSGQARDQAAIKRVKAHLQHPRLQDPDRLHSARARFLFHHLFGAATFATNELDACSDHLTKALAILDAERAKFRDEANLALSTLSNLIVVKMRLGRSQEALELLNSFRTLPDRWDMPRNEDLDLKLFVTTTSLELTIHSLNGNFDQALQLTPMVERGLVKYEDRLGPMRKASFYYQMAYIHLGMGDPEKAIRWTNKLLNDIRIDESAEIVSFGRILHLIAHLDAKKLDLLSYSLRNTGRFLATRERMHRFEEMVLRMVRSVIRSRNEKEAQKAYRKFKEELSGLENDPLEQVVFEHLDPIAWAESKLCGRDFGELVRERKAGVLIAR